MKKQISNRKKDESNSVKTPNTIAPDASTGTKTAGRENEETSPKKPLSVSEIVRETLHNSYEHPYVVVNEDSDIIAVYGDIRPFFGPSSEQSEHNLLRLVNTELQNGLRSALYKASRNRIGVKSEIKIFALDGSDHYIRIHTKPLVNQAEGEELYVVIFEKIDINDFPSRGLGPETETAAKSRIVELERELSTTKQHLQNFIAEMKSSDEALQSINEELETSKEELQRSNEEIQIAYTALKAVNEKLEKKEKKLIEIQANTSALLNNDLQAFILVNRKYKILDFNAKASSIFKKISKKTLAKDDSVIDIFPAPQIETFISDFKTALDGKTFVGEKQFISKDGQTHWFRVNYAPVLIDNKNVAGISIGLLDITEGKELQDLLDHANRLARIGGWEVDLINNTLYQSPITREIHEVSDDYQPDLDSAINFYRNDVRDLVKKFVNEAVEQGTPWDIELPLITAKGNERWVRSIGQSEFRGGKCVRLYGSFQDIHEKRVAEMRLKNMADNVPGVIFRFILHEDGANEMLNLTKGAHTLWGASAEACMNDPEIIWNQTRAGGDYDHVMETILLSAKTLNQWKCQYRSRNPDGRVLWLEGSGSPQRLSNGSVLWDTLLIDISDKKELEDLLKRSSQMARIGSWELSINQEGSDKMYWSEMTREILGVDHTYNPSLTGGFEFYNELSKTQIQNAVANLIEHGIDFDLELLITTAKNQPRWIRCIGQSERIDNRCIKIFGSFQEIHQRKIAELEVHKAFEEKNTILESIGDAFFAVDRDFTVTYWNKEAEYELNTKREDILNRKLWDVFGDAVDLEFGHQYRNAMKTGETVTFEAYYPGEKKWFEVSVYPSDMGLSVYFKDVSQRRTIEERIRQSNERFEKVTEATNDAIWDWDIETNHSYWGKGFNTIFGYDLERQVTNLKAWTKYIHKEDLKKVMDSLDAVIQDASRSNWQQEYRYQKKSGGYAFVMDRGVVIRGKSGKAIRMVGAMSDITQRKTFEESLQKLNEKLDLRAEQLAISNADLEQFAFVASHDLQEPLRMVTGFLSQLDRKYTHVLDDKGRQYIHFAVDGAKRMRQIILDILEFSKVGRQEIAGEKIDLNKLMHETIAIHGTVIEERDAKIHVEFLPTVFSQKAPLLQVFQNLIGNALKYTHKDVKPEISVTVSETKAEWTIAIRDNGIGIDAAYFEKIFVIFQRLHAVDEYEGTGMGLAIVKKIIDNLGGKIWLESKEGQGSTFFFTLGKAEKI